MTTAVYPHLPPDRLKKEEEDSTARELSWLLESLQETLVSLKSGLEECYALLAPIEPGSTLVMSSPRSESVKGHVTRVGTRIVKGTLHLRLKTLPHTHISLTPALPALESLRAFLNQALDCVDITRWTGDRHSAAFISGQLRLLHSILVSSLSLLSGSPPSSSSPSSPPWTSTATPHSPSDPSYPPNLSLHLTPSAGSLILTVRVLEPITAEPSLGLVTKLAFAIGAQRRLEHDEMEGVFVVAGERVRVREKVVVESSADPMLLVLGAKLGALERTVEAGRMGLGVVCGEEVDV
ncbi:hypothetical protein LSUB1_G003551 [Lachnellula subtilissima]|uniref:RAVE subunit 2/Rogdi n=1 Tax=Lachnellula subtilissima TaxID=602034 RepID=A0A8H8RQU0_9HELO|nr:hypothetical protein LSUB1_G003551 [Lachnellula subtilissima]